MELAFALISFMLAVRVPGNAEYIQGIYTIYFDSIQKEQPVEQIVKIMAFNLLNITIKSIGVDFIGSQRAVF